MRLGSRPTWVDVVLTVYVPSVITGFGHGMILPALPAIAQAYDVAPGLAAQVVTAQYAGRTIALFPAGFVVDRFGRKPAMIAGPIVMFAALVATVTAPWFWVVLVAQAALGVGEGIWSFGREILAVDQTRPEHRGRVIGSFFGISSASVALGPVLGGHLTEIWGYASVFALHAVLSLAVLGLAFMVTESKRTSRVAASHGGNPFDLSSIEPRNRNTFRVLLYATMCAMLRNSSLQSLLPIYVVTYLGYGPSEAGYLFGLSGMVQLLLIAPAGTLCDKVGRKAATVPAAALAGVGYAAIYLSTDMFGLTIASIIMGMSAGFAIGTMTVFTYDIVPPANRGQLQALRRTVGEIGTFSGPILGAAVAAAYANNVGVAFLLFAPMHLVSAALLAFVARETNPRANARRQDSALAAKP